MRVRLGGAGVTLALTRYRRWEPWSSQIAVLMVLTGASPGVVRVDTLVEFVCTATSHVFWKTVKFGSAKTCVVAE